MKDRCLPKNSILRSNLPVQEFYTEYEGYCLLKNIKPLTKVAIGRTLLLSNELGINTILPYVDKKRVRAYNRLES
jgi:hypothetical protein